MLPAEQMSLVASTYHRPSPIAGGSNAWRYRAVEFCSSMLISIVFFSDLLRVVR